ncbi:TIGR00282 family metallophosphoesterase [Magnetofaba australis]|nr:TIGR00282 family metallophosphoesterase [Magnetofaba australis]
MAEAAHSDETVRILIFGDVVGRPGRRALKEHLPTLRKTHCADAVIVNGENAAAGIGVTPDTAEELFAAGADLITSGNHVWRYRDIHEYMGRQRRLLRPMNYPPGAPGHGHGVFQTDGGVRIGVLNLIGRVFMEPVDCPFRAADAFLDKISLGREADVIIVDMHAEATSEKVAMGRYLDGRVSAVVGTHTHIPTADHRVLAGGCGYMTDLGMTGCYESVIGMELDSVLPRFTSKLPSRFEAAQGEASISGALIVVNRRTGRCESIQPVRRGPDLDATPDPL